jgi:KDO2-lipid IV(A) lauroyltransferase
VIDPAQSLGHPTVRPEKPTTPVRPEKLRRRIRARALGGLTHAAGVVPQPLFHGALAALAPLAGFTRFEALTRANLELALGDTTSPADRARIARGVRRHCARQFAEWVHLARGAPPDSERGRWIEDLVELDATVAVLDEELRRGRGALVVTAHLGNWELLAARLRRAGHPGAVVGYARPNDSTSRWFEGLRRGYGVETIAQSQNPRAILRALDAGLVVGLLADLEVRRLDGEFLPFFGRPALTMTAPAALARAAGTRLLPARCVFERASGRYRLAFDAPLAPDLSLDRRARTSDLSGRLNRVFESWIRAAPEQWSWHQPRWRTQPGTPPVPAARRPWGGPAGVSLQSPDQGLAVD